MSYPTFAPTLLGEKIILRDVNVGLDEPTRLAIFEKISRLIRYDERITRIYIELTQDAAALPAEGSPSNVTARGTLEMGGPSLLASVTSPDATSALEFLLDKFDRQLRRRSHARHLVA